MNIRGGAGVAERDRLLSDCRALNSTGGSNPPLPATYKKTTARWFFISNRRMMFSISIGERG